MKEGVIHVHQSVRYHHFSFPKLISLVSSQARGKFLLEFVSSSFLHILSHQTSSKFQLVFTLSFVFWHLRFKLSKQMLS